MDDRTGAASLETGPQWVPLRMKTGLATTWMLVLALTSVIYVRVVCDLVRHWWSVPDFSYGFLVPPFAGYLVWVKRKRLMSFPFAPSWNGPVLVALGLAALLLGTFASELFLSRFSLLLVVAGLVASYGGCRLLIELRWVLAVLLLAIPLPAIVFNQVTFPLQLFASGVASELLPMIGVPVLREGNVLVLPELRLEVAEACSGIRSLMSLLALSIFYGYFFEHSMIRRALLALSSIPIAITGNVLRLLGTGFCVRHWNPDRAMGFFHEFSGWVTYLVSFACMFVFHQVLRLLLPERRAM
jgi:exosortase